MQIKRELKRLGTVEFWKNVRYWSAIKWTGKLTQPIPEEEWLPIIVSVLSGLVLLSAIVCLIRLLGI